MDIIKRAIFKLIKKYTPNGIKLQFASVSYVFPIGLKFHSVTILFNGFFQAKLDIVKIEINNPFRLLLNTSYKKFSIQCNSVKVIRMTNQNKVMTTKLNQLNKIQAKFVETKFLSSLITRILKNVKSITFSEFRLKNFSILNFVLKIIA